MKKELIFGVIVILIVLAGGIRLLNKKTLLPKTGVVNLYQNSDSNTQTTTTTSLSTGTPTELAITTGSGITLTVSHPQANQTVKTGSIRVSGKSVPNADISINEKDLKADTQGNFSTSINLDEGENIITVVAVNEFGKTAEKDITVTYQVQ
jgi:hypothetical protein